MDDSGENGDDGPGAQVIALAGGAAKIHLPGEWDLTGINFFDALFEVSWLDGAHLAVKLRAFADPAAVRENDLARFLTDRPFPDLSDRELRYDGEGRIDYAQILRRADGHRTPDRARAPEVREAFTIWRRIGVVPDGIVRRLDFQLWFREELEDSEDAQEVRRFLNRAIPLAEFAPYPVDSDRVAGVPRLRTVSLWNALHFRVPANWPDVERHEPENDGPYKFDDPDPESRWTLWIDYAITGEAVQGLSALPPDETAADAAESMRQSGNYENVWVDPMPERPDEAATKSLRSSVEDGEPLRHITWCRIVHVDNRVMTAEFRWVVIKSALDDRDIRALDALVEAEVLNAVITNPDAPPPVRRTD